MLTPRRSARPPVRSTGLVSAAVALALVMSGCGASSSDSKYESTGGNDATPYRVSFILGLTGFLTQASTAIRDGAQAAVDSINADGGIDGRKIEFAAIDDKSDATQAVTVLQSEINDARPSMVFAGISSNEALATAPD